MAKAPGEGKYLYLGPSVAGPVEELIRKNRAELIKSTVKDAAAARELLAINEAIQKLGGHSPDLVAAWGLGCGGHCLVGPDIVRGDPIGGSSR